MATTQPLVATDLDPTHWLTPYVTFAMNGAVPEYDSATKAAVTVGSGGSGYSTRSITGGESLYTPSGGWANYPIGQDWKGANTIIALCRVSGVDTYGGIFTKTVDGGEIQLAVGKFSVEDNFYVAVDNTNLGRLIATTLSATTTLGVIAFTHSGGTTTPMSYYRNGTYVDVSGNLGTQASGTGVLRLGVNGTEDASYDSDVDWLAFIRVNKVLTAGEIATISANVWDMWLDGSTPDGAGKGFIKISGSWKNLSGVYVNVAGTWKSGQFSPNVSGSWKTLA